MFNSRQHNHLVLSRLLVRLPISVGTAGQSSSTSSSGASSSASATLSDTAGQSSSASPSTSSVALPSTTEHETVAPESSSPAQEPQQNPHEARASGHQCGQYPTPPPQSSNSDDASKEAKQCPIHLGELSDPFTTYCGHSFCRQCIMPWVKEHRTCPVCRRYAPSKPPFPCPRGLRTHQFYPPGAPIDLIEPSPATIVNPPTLRQDQGSVKHKPLSVAEEHRPSTSLEHAEILEGGVHHCPVCDDQLTARVTTPCHHTLCRRCLSRWLLNDGPSCPICRVPIPPNAGFAYDSGPIRRQIVTIPSPTEEQYREFADEDQSPALFSPLDLPISRLSLYRRLRRRQQSIMEETLPSALPKRPAVLGPATPSLTQLTTQLSITAQNARSSPLPASTLHVPPQSLRPRFILTRNAHIQRLRLATQRLRGNVQHTRDMADRFLVQRDREKLDSADWVYYDEEQRMYEERVMRVGITLRRAEREVVELESMGTEEFGEWRRRERRGGIREKTGT